MKMPFVDNELLRLHLLIKAKSTGTPEQLARKLHCAISTVYNKIKTLREYGLPVVYCPVRGSYYYEQEVQISFCVMLNGEEMARITGGNCAPAPFPDDHFLPATT